MDGLDILEDGVITFYCFSPRSMYESCDLPLPSPPPPPLKPTPPGFLHSSRLVDAMESLDSTSGGMVRKVLLKLKERSVEPFPLDDWLYFCEHCAKYTTHTTANHICHHCHAMDSHKSEACPKVRDRFCSFCASMATRAPSAHSSADHLCFQCHARGQHLTCLLPQAPTRAFTQASSWFHRAPFCSFCDKTASHDTYMHVCRLCKQVGDHRSADCPSAREPCAFCTATSHATSEHVCHHCKQVGDHRGLHCTTHSTPGFFPKKLTDMEAKLRWTLASMGLWSGGSQTPLTTPRHLSHPSPHAEPSTLSATTYVLSYMEGKSIVPARVLKYMRLLMHHDVPTNAFDVVVRIDIWEMKRPGMVSPQSFPATPRLRSQHHTRMNAYTESVLKGARVKLEGLIRQQYGDAAIR
ncbi:hypothetical protein SPRG_09038 [Saprolegnia parasitica CBS 223.65]|uniref:CCHC-type domain-containing protein n=1 Tax=Saprolegnia parasitica (strain CBS 223.65) TaxID=695850 RepID=A0A067C4Q8_SAPPC|nr:hypothetical protein SPRG_09038 [Saprolegnia parasitica CBS 223.65]KDO25739.1 hypothetical protein SPRG_09038 [Saprolegnia parasitica CBS 223.65]|eukprot:XP_012203548.1 hypothetical protein SPRG_09038 [Saprolegnia parasitica CBS 223.65]